MGLVRARRVNSACREIVYALFDRADPVRFEPTFHGVTNGAEALPNSAPKFLEPATERNADLARCFLRLANLPNFALDRLSRYEATLWRQAGQILFALDDRIGASHKRKGAVCVSVADNSSSHGPDEY